MLRRAAAAHNRPTWHVRYHRRPRSHDGIRTYARARPHGATHADQSAFPYPNIAGQGAAGRDMGGSAEPTVVVEDCPRIDDGQVTNAHVRSDDGMCHDDCTAAQPRAW